MKNIDYQEVLLYAFVIVLAIVSLVLLYWAIVYNNSAAFVIGNFICLFAALILPKSREKF